MKKINEICQSFKKNVNGRKKTIIIAVSLLLVMAAAIEGTIAFIITNTSKVNNTFEAGEVACSVEENFDGTTKRDVAVKNDGNVNIYVRAIVNVTWAKNEDSSAQEITAKVPVEGTDYEITYPVTTAWFQGADGYWYYKNQVEAGDSTRSLFNSCEVLSTASVPEGYHLSVEIVASAIQADPASTVTSQWGVTISNGKIVSAGGGV